MNVNVNLLKLDYRLLTALGIGIASASWIQTQSAAVTVRVDRWLSVRNMIGTVTFLGPNTSRPAQAGDRLTQVGDGVRTAAQASAQLEVDTGIGFIEVSEQTEVRVQSLDMAADGGRITHLSVPQGQVRARIRTFTHQGSELEIQTPSGISGVRGTDFGLTVQPDGKAGTATLEGAIETSAAGETVWVPGGFQNLMLPGQPPTEPVPLRNDPSLDFRLVRFFRNNVRYVALVGQVDPVNAVYMNGEPISIDADGSFRIERAAVTRVRVEIQVVTPLGREQIHPISML
jgi:hypothetical protein